MPAVSIVTALHNKGPFIAETIRSVQAQTLRDWEMIIVENGSSDDGPAIAHLLATTDPRVKNLIADKNGPGHARNQGLASASGDWILFLDADDLIEPGYLESRIAASKNSPDAQIVAGPWKEFQNGKSDVVETKFPTGFGGSMQIVLDSAISTAPWILHAALVRRHWLTGNRCWPEELDGKPSEDGAFWFRVALDAEIAWGDHPGALYRIVGADSREGSAGTATRALALLDIVRSNVAFLRATGSEPNRFQRESILHVLENSYRRVLSAGAADVAHATCAEATYWLQLCPRDSSPAIFLRKLVGIQLFNQHFRRSGFSKVLSRFQEPDKPRESDQSLTQNMMMTWLIVEDALRDHQGHWFEYVRTFQEGLQALGDRVDVLVDHEAEPFITNTLAAKPVLPQSIWHQMGGQAGPVSRLLRIAVHGWKTFLAVRKYVRTSKTHYDVVFVPTILPHHLLGWLLLLKTVFRGSKTRFIFFFLSTPVSRSPNGEARFDKSPAALILRILIRALAGDVASARVVLAAETFELRDALSAATSVPFCYLPQPVELHVPERTHKFPLIIGCYGAARAEKGSDIMQDAVAAYLQTHPGSDTRFVIQWIHNFTDSSGQLVTKHKDLLSNENVTFIDRYFEQNEYAKMLEATDIVLVPYRQSSYGLRGSRLVIDAMVNGLPVVITEGIAPAAFVRKYGAGVEFADGSVSSLQNAIETCIQEYSKLCEKACRRIEEARNHFSVQTFKAILELNIADKTSSHNINTKTDSPLLITGSHRTGKTTIANLLMNTGKFWLIHEPFSNYRGKAHVSSIITNLRNIFTYICDSNERLYISNVADILRYNAFSYKTAIDGGINARKILRYVYRRATGLRHGKRPPIIDDPFLVFSAEWLVKAFNCHAIIMIRNPLDFVASCKQMSFGFEFDNLTRQPHLLNGPLLPYALEIRQLSSNASKTAKHVQNAYLWKYIYSCVRNYKKTYPDWLFLYFECLNTTAPSELLNWIYDKYKIDLPFHSIQPATSKNLIRRGEGKLCSSNYRNVLSAEEIQDILTITHDVAISFYKESDITIPLAAT